MNNKYTTILTLFFLILLFKQSQSYCQDTSAGDSVRNCCYEVKNLNLRIDSLEARIENLQIQIVESDPFKSAKYLHWGKGLMFTVNKSEKRISTDAGYIFLTPKLFRMGISAGFDGQFGVASSLPEYSFYGKVTYGTPVLINFISINCYTRALFYPKPALTEENQTTGGLSAGAEIEFWFTQSWCYTFGGSFTSMRGRGTFDSHNVGEVNFAGFKYFPQCRRKKI